MASHTTKSDTNSNFEAQHEDDIIRVAAYHRKEFDHAVIRFKPNKDDQLIQKSISEPFPSVPTANLGMLDPLPIEIIHMIFLKIEISSLLQFRQINVRASQVVAAFAQYQKVAKYAPDALRAMSKTGLATYHKMFQLYNVLCTRNCSTCGSFGGFIFLPSCSRCCFDCIRSHSELRILSLRTAEKYSYLPPQYIRNVMPVVHTVPGVYSMDEIPSRKRMRIVAEDHVVLACCIERQESGLFSLASLPESYRLRFMAATALPFLDLEHDRIQYGMCCRGCQVAFKKKIDSGDEKLVLAARDHVYSREGFLEHFKLCEEAQKLWESERLVQLKGQEPRGEAASSTQGA